MCCAMLLPSLLKYLSVDRSMISKILSDSPRWLQLRTIVSTSPARSSSQDQMAFSFTSSNFSPPSAACSNVSLSATATSIPSREASMFSPRSDIDITSCHASVHLARTQESIHRQPASPASTNQYTDGRNLASTVPSSPLSSRGERSYDLRRFSLSSMHASNVVGSPSEAFSQHQLFPSGLGSLKGLGILESSPRSNHEESHISSSSSRSPNPDPQMFANLPRNAKRSRAMSEAQHLAGHFRQLSGLTPSRSSSEFGRAHQQSLSQLQLQKSDIIPKHPAQMMPTSGSLARTVNRLCTIANSSFRRSSMATSFSESTTATTSEPGTPLNSSLSTSFGSMNTGSNEPVHAQRGTVSHDSALTALQTLKQFLAQNTANADAASGFRSNPRDASVLEDMMHRLSCSIAEQQP